MRDLLDEAKTKLTEHKSELKATQQELTALSADIASESTPGPFAARLIDCLNSYRIRKRLFHGGTFVGGDCDRIMTNAKAIAGCLGRTRLIDSAGDKAVAGDDASALKFSANLTKLKIASLSSIDHAHYARTKSTRETRGCASWPRSFTPKFHLLGWHMVPFARVWRSIGLAAEQGVESTHRIFNRRHTTFAGICGVVMKLKSAVKHFLLKQNDSTTPRQRAPKTTVTVMLIDDLKK